MEFSAHPALREVPEPYYGGEAGSERVLDRDWAVKGPSDTRATSNESRKCQPGKAVYFYSLPGVDGSDA